VTRRTCRPGEKKPALCQESCSEKGLLDKEKNPNTWVLCNLIRPRGLPPATKQLRKKVRGLARKSAPTESLLDRPSSREVGEKKENGLQSSGGLLLNSGEESQRSTHGPNSQDPPSHQGKGRLQDTKKRKYFPRKKEHPGDSWYRGKKERRTYVKH